MAVESRCIRREPTGNSWRAYGIVHERPPHCLHPTIKIHSPLVFDLVDTSVGKESIGGCTYHVVHPRRPGLRVVFL